MKINFTKHKFLTFIMRTYIFLLCTTVFSFFSEGVLSQNAKIVIDTDKILTVDQVFDIIKKQTDYTFIYRSNLFKNAPKVRLKKGIIKASKLLKEGLSFGDFIYSFSDDETITLREKIEEGESKIQKEIRGTVSDISRTILPGVNVIVVGTTIGTSTDFDGNYTIKASKGDVLEFSYVGLVKQRITVADKTTINVIMLEDSSSLEEVVLVGYGYQKKANVVGSVTSINPSELRVSSSNLTTALAGRLSGLISYQRSGEPGENNAEFFIRGVTTFGYNRSPLILIDGIELGIEELSRLQSDDVASFSILKDATATSIYGARGANGIILITTKTGIKGKINVSVRLENSFSQATKNIDIADPVTFMRLHNEAVKTRDAIAILPYSERKIANTIAGVNPFVYPAVNWRDELFNDYTLNQKININLSGGGNKVRYYLATSYTIDNGLLKNDKDNNFDSNINYRILTARSNVNVDLTKTTEAIIRFNGSFDDYSGPIDGGAALYRASLRANPVLFPKFFKPDEANEFTNHILFGNADNGNYLNPYAVLARGYKEFTKSFLLSQLEVKQNLKFITEGLKARFVINTTRKSEFDIRRRYNPYYYTVGFYSKEDDNYTLEPLNEERGTEYLGYSESNPRLSTAFYLEATTDYSRIFNEKHDVSALLVYNMRSSIQNNSGSLQRSLPYRNLGVSGRMAYAFDSKYFAEFSFGYNGSEKFSKNNRFGFFPAIGIGWTVSKEPFFKPLSSVISKLKLKATYGLVGNDAIGNRNDRFFYLSQVNLDNDNRGYRFGTDLDYRRDGVTIDRYSNRLISWETAKKINLGLELSLFDDAFNIQFDVFKEERENILMNRASIPSSLGLEAGIRANVGEAESEGFDFSIDYNGSLGNSWWLSGRANFTYATGKFKKFEEPDYSNTTPWLSRVGQPIGQRWGYVAERLFVDENEVLNSPQQFGLYGAGDIKYRDLNEDGIIDFRDTTPIGYPIRPEIVYGFGLSAGYKNFDLSVFLQGNARVSFWIDIFNTAPFIGRNGNNAVLQVYADSYWSEDNQDIYAIWPRLSTFIVNNNRRRNTWFLRNGAFMRLKQVELGYSLPDTLSDKLGIGKFRVYLTGTNLLTISKFKLWDVEMGGRGLGYPIQKVFNLGVELKF